MSRSMLWTFHQVESWEYQEVTMATSTFGRPAMGPLEYVLIPVDFFQLFIFSSPQRELKGHVGDILTCKFFPSGKVILSGGRYLVLVSPLN